MKRITHIFDGDYGCEAREDGAEPKVSVTVVDDFGKEEYITVADSWLAAHGLDVSSVWPEE
ncbi:MAG: hypothetical protein MRZ36_07235 [Eubacterium sp.]|nr:hypothetical protein [Eubacterium sp.]